MAPARGSLTDRGKSSSSSSSSSRPNSMSGASAKEGKEGRKMGSLSSPPVSKPVDTPTGSSGAGPPSGKSFVRTASGDARLMPPPAVPVKRDNGSGGSGGQASSSRPRAPPGFRMDRSNGKAAGKGKEKEVLGGVDDFQLLGSSNPNMASGMWADMYAPETIADLAPGKARIASTRDWMHLAIHGHSPDQQPIGPHAASACDKMRKYKRILLVTGPPGIAKTTSVRVIAREMGVELVEWGEGVEEYSLGSSGFNRESPITKLSTFLSRQDYSPLALSTSSQPRTSRPRILLITSIPNLSHGATKAAFHDALAAFARTYSSSSAPLIIVHSESGNRGAAEESWRDRDRAGRDGALEVLGKAVLEGPWSHQISFLPIAPTFMLKALRRVLELARKTNDFDPPAATALQLVALTSNGDLRAAINSIQLLCTHGQARDDGDGANGKKRKGAKSERGASKVAVVGKDARGWVKSKLDVPKSIRAVLDALTRKEQNLNLFHALGKVLYNKRLGDPGQAEEDQELVAYISSRPPQDLLPRHLRDFTRKPSLVIVDDFVGNIPVDASSFALWLHQNAPSNCVEIEEASALLDDLGSADIMKTDDDIWQSSTQAIAYALHISIRGVQMGLPSPVPRRGAKVVKPQFFQAYKDERKNTDLVDVASAYVTKKAVAASNILAERGVNDGSDAIWGGMMSQGVLAGEVLPMMIKMQGLTSRPLLPAAVAPLRLAPYDTETLLAEELTATQDGMEDVDMDMSGPPDEVPDHAAHGWDQDEEEKVDEVGWLEEDDIMDFD